MTSKRARDRRRVLDAAIATGRAYVETKHIDEQLHEELSPQYIGFLLSELAEHGALEVEKDNNTRTLYRVPEGLRG